MIGYHTFITLTIIQQCYRLSNILFDLKSLKFLKNNNVYLPKLPSLRALSRKELVNSFTET